MMQPPADPPRVGLIGVSGYAETHLGILRALSEERGVDFRAAVAVNAADVPGIVGDLSSRGVRVYESTHTFFAEQARQLDLCVIPTSIASHAPLTIAALRAGMNVLVEKPVAGSLADVAAIREAENASGGRFVAVGYQDMYDASTRWLKEAVCSGAIGAVRKVRMLGLWPRDRSYYRRNSWAGRLRVEGAAVFDSPFQNAFAHFVHLALFLAGRELRESARVQIVSAELLRAHEIESFDSGVVRAASPDGVTFWFGASHACRETFEPVVHVSGTQGSIEWSSTGDRVLRTRDGSVENRTAADHQTSGRLVYDVLLRRLRDPSVFISTVEMAAAHTALIEALHQSGIIVSVPASLIDHHQIEGAPDTVPVIRGLESALHRAYAAHSTLSQAGFSLQSSPP